MQPAMLPSPLKLLYLFLVYLFFVLAVPANCLAGSFNVNPIKVFFRDGAKTSAIEVTNNAVSEKVTLQMKGVKWTQDSTGKDVYEDAAELVIFPKIVTLDPNEKKIIRLGYQGVPIADREAAYRIFLEELPVDKPGELGLKVALKLSVPIFLVPKKENKDWVLEEASAKKGAASVIVKNNGNTHLIVTKVTAKGFDETDKELFSNDIGGWYLLAGTKKTYSVPLPADGCPNLESAKATVEIERTSRDLSLKLDPSLCVPQKDD